MGERREQVKILVAEGWTVATACREAGLSRSSWYYEPRPRAKRPLNPELSAEIRRETGLAPVYGVRKVMHALRRKGRRANKKAVWRHMNRMGLVQPRRVKGPKHSGVAKIVPLQPNTYWEGDLTYVWAGRDGFGFAFPVLDAFDRNEVGEHFSGSATAVEAAAALERAVLARFGGPVPEGHTLILRVDRGPQFVARLYRETARVLGVTLQFAGVQCPNDKPYVESFIGHYKVEEVYRHDYECLAEAREGWHRYRRWYASVRLHQSLGYRTPVEVATAAATSDSTRAA